VYLTCSTPIGTFSIPLGAGAAALRPSPTGCGCQKSQPILLPFNIICNLTDQPYAPRQSPPGQLSIPTTTAAPGTAAAARDAAKPLAVADTMSQLTQGVTPGGGSQGCASVNSPCRVDPVKGNLVAQIRTPSAGPADPRPMLTYHSDSLAAGGFGMGWSGLFAAKVVGPVSYGGQTYATVYRGDGSVLVYQESFGVYFPTGAFSSANMLVQNANGSWTETQSNGLSFVYQHATADLLTRIVGISGLRRQP
jgi:hypothetical protein